MALGAGVRLVLYPRIDVVASLIGARTQHGAARRLLLGGAAVSAAAAALGVAATGTVADVLAVFGVWAGLSGAAQLVVALRRRAQLGNRWPMLLAGGVSVIAGVAYLVAAAGTPMLSMLAIYAATAARTSSSRPGCSRGAVAASPPRRLAGPAGPVLSAS